MKRILKPSAPSESVPAGFVFWGGVMSEAMKMIVDGYVRLKDRESLEQLRNHRRRLRQEIREHGDNALDQSYSLQTFDAEVLVIEAALEKLRGLSATG
jgi:hypothetical protein